MSVNRKEVYKCIHCGNIVEILTAGGGQLICCGEPMVLQKENTVDASKEKHVPVAEALGNGTLVKVGAIPHPMEPDHYIEWIQVDNGEYINRKYLKPGEAPQAEFYVPFKKGLVIKEYCNKHGLWKS